MSDRSINPDDHNDINLSGSPQQGPPKLGGGRWMPFEEAREFVRGLGFTSNVEWVKYAKSGQKPNDIPATPREVYRDEWRSWGDWLGTGHRRGGWRPFEEAREFAQALGLKNVKEWEAYCASGQKPDDIPAIPSRVYKDSGWRGWGDWLGTGNVSTRRSFRPFEEAKEFARGLGIKSQKEWVEYSKSGKLPTDIPSNPQQVYKDEFRGLGDWIGIINIWKRPALLAFLEDLRPHLGRLEEAELYAIIAQSGAMRAFRIAFDGVDSPAPGSVIQDLKGNDGQGVAEAIKGISEEELQEAALSGGETPKEVLGPEMLTETLAEEDAPPEEYLTGENGGGLPELATPQGLRIVDELAALHYGLDDEAADFLVRNRVAALWSAYINEGPATAEAALAGEGGHYFGLIRSRFWEELRSVEELPIPGGWSFRPARVRIDSPPVPPNLMQKRTAYEVLTHKRVGNWSSVGTGKTIAAVLASRVANRKHTLIITNKATIGGWRREILSAYPDSVVHTEASNSNGSKGAHSYTILNYERFQLPSRGELVRKLAEAGVDFIVFDEVQLVKQRDQDASIRRKAVEGLVSLLSEHTEGDLHVLGLSATPVINNLLEARKLLEVVQGRSFADLDTQATAANALAVHRALMVYGFRYRAPYEMEVDLRKVQVEGNDLLDDLRFASGVLDVEQVLLPAKLDAVRDYIRPGVVIYTQYVDAMVEPIRRFVEHLGYRVGLYTGSDKSGLEDFLDRRVDVLVGSKPVGTGLDGLQRVCDRIIAVSLPWTSAEWEQLEGRIRRQGSAFEKVSMVVPQVVLEHKGEEWSWDKHRWRAIEYKRTLSDCAVDGRIPEASRMSPERLLAKSREALEEWIERIEGEDLNLSEMRPHLRVPLPPEVRRKLVVSRGDFATLNNRWNTSNSETVHERLEADPAEWYLYHTLYREAREEWPEVPALRIADELRLREDLRVGDFGAGECLLRDALPNHDVVSLDYVALDEGVVACDMAHTSLEDGELGAAVFSLSLMGRNWRDYLAEAHRTLRPFGLVFIAEPARRWEDGVLEEALEGAGFDPLRTVRRGDFIYARGVKR